MLILLLYNIPNKYKYNFQAISEENTDNQFVTLLNPDENVDTITLTSAQAAALGYSFEIDSIEEPKTLWQNDETLVSQNDTSPNNNVSIESLGFKPQIIPQQNTIKVLSNCDVENWSTIQNLNSQMLQVENTVQQKVQPKSSGVIFSSPSFENKSVNRSPIFVKANSSQFVLKPAQSVTKNVQIFPKVNGNQF